jgi:hypothetical protein
MNTKAKIQQAATPCKLFRPKFIKGRPERRRQFVAFSKRMSHRLNETIPPVLSHLT